MKWTGNIIEVLCVTGSKEQQTVSVFQQATPALSQVNGLARGGLMGLRHGDVARIGLMQDLPQDASGSREAVTSDKPGPTCKNANFGRNTGC